MAKHKHRFDRVKRAPAYKIVADELLKAVVERELRPGDMLSIELAEQFGVNRSTVREGIRHLEQTGLVERQGKRLVISRPSYHTLGDQVSMALVVHDVTFQELWDVKMALEPLAASLASASASPAHLARLRENLEEPARRWPTARIWSRWIWSFTNSSQTLPRIGRLRLRVVR